MATWTNQSKNITDYDSFYNALFTQNNNIIFTQNNRPILIQDINNYAASWSNQSLNIASWSNQSKN